VLLVSALWLAVVQALASSAVPAGVRAPVAGSSRAASVEVTATVAATATDDARLEKATGTRLWTLQHGDEEFRPPVPQRLPAVVDRTNGRGVPPLRPPAGLARFASADLSVSLASVAPLAAAQPSHAAASRGGHLPYYPTAPPLQG
jgi:hypothetical protein